MMKVISSYLTFFKPEELEPLRQDTMNCPVPLRE